MRRDGLLHFGIPNKREVGDAPVEVLRGRGRWAGVGSGVWPWRWRGVLIFRFLSSVIVLVCGAFLSTRLVREWVPWVAKF